MMMRVLAGLLYQGGLEFPMRAVVYGRSRVSSAMFVCDN